MELEADVDCIALLKDRIIRSREPVISSFRHCSTKTFAIAAVNGTIRTICQGFISKSFRENSRMCADG
jgi:hypothetical protein